MDGVFSLRMLAEMTRKMDAMPSILPTMNPLWQGNINPFGVRVHSTPAFPMVVVCKACDGTGEGVVSTYCDKCDGQGQNRFEGMMRNGPQTILLTVPLPKAFKPSFPTGVVVALPPICRGLPCTR